MATESILDAGSYADDAAWNDNTDNWDGRKIKVMCPQCKVQFSALACKSVEMVDSGWRWVGCEYKEPYARYRVTHRKCGRTMEFTTYTPQ